MSTSRSDDLIAQGKPLASALTSGYHVAFWIGAGLVAAAIVVAATVLESVPQSAQHAPGESGETAYSEAA